MVALQQAAEHLAALDLSRPASAGLDHLTLRARANVFVLFLRVPEIFIVSWPARGLRPRCRNDQQTQELGRSPGIAMPARVSISLRDLPLRVSAS